MSKRLNNSHSSTRISSDSESNYSDSENDPNTMPLVKRRKYNSVSQQIIGKHLPKINCPREENEHTYSSIPIFNNMDNNELKIGSSSDSDYDKFSRSRSPESLRSGKNKFSSKRRPKCNSKNAVMARMNRQRKKEYVEKLEGEIKYLKEINNGMKTELLEQKELVNKLRNEIGYLRSALSNSKQIGVLLRTIAGSSGNFKVTSSLLSTPPPSEAEVNLSSFNFNEDTNRLSTNEVSPSSSSDPEAEVSISSLTFKNNMTQFNTNEVSPPPSEPEADVNLSNFSFGEGTSQFGINEVYSSDYSDIFFNSNDFLFSPESFCTNDSGLGSPEFTNNDFEDLDINLVAPQVFNDDFSLMNDVSLFNSPDKNILDWPTSQSFDTDHLIGLQNPLLADLADFGSDESFGVCLHVSKKQVSLEFCELCRRNSSLGILNEEGLPMVK